MAVVPKCPWSKKKQYNSLAKIKVYFKVNKIKHHSSKRILYHTNFYNKGRNAKKN